MKKLLFIASVGLLFSCSNNDVCTCTTTDINGVTYTESYDMENLDDPEIWCDGYDNNIQGNIGITDPDSTVGIVSGGCYLD